MFGERSRAWASPHRGREGNQPTSPALLASLLRPQSLALFLALAPLLVPAPGLQLEPLATAPGCGPCSWPKPQGCSSSSQPQLGPGPDHGPGSQPQLQPLIRTTAPDSSTRFQLQHPATTVRLLALALLLAQVSDYGSWGVQARQGAGTTQKVWRPLIESILGTGVFTTQNRIR